MQRVLTEFENDLALFISLLREFTEFLFESEQAQVRVDPVAEQERAGESWEQALEQVDELIHERIQALSADEAVAAVFVAVPDQPMARSDGAGLDGRGNPRAKLYAGHQDYGAVDLVHTAQDLSGRTTPTGGHLARHGSA